MTTLVNLLVGLLATIPVLERIFMKVFEAFMKKKHQLDVADFVKAELKARQTGNTKDLQEILGRRLR